MSDLNLPGTEDGVQGDATTDSGEHDREAEVQVQIGEDPGDVSFGTGRTPPPPG